MQDIHSFISWLKSLTDWSAINKGSLLVHLYGNFIFNEQRNSYALAPHNNEEGKVCNHHAIFNPLNLFSFLPTFFLYFWSNRWKTVSSMNRTRLVNICPRFFGPRLKMAQVVVHVVFVIVVDKKVN